MLPSVLLLPQWVENLAGVFGTDGTVILTNAVRIVGIWLLAWLALALVRLVAARIEAAVNDQNDSYTTAREKRGRTISLLVRGVGRVVVFVGAVLLTLNIFMNIAPILGATAILGLAVSFGAQSLVKDVITGFFMLLEDQFGVGDVIEAAGKSGSVESLSLRVVKLRGLDGTLHIIPNGEITSVSNMTRGWSRAVLEIGVSYDADLDKALAAFRDEARIFSERPEWQAKLDAPLEVPGIEKLAADSVVIRVLAQTRPGLQWDVARAFRLAIKKRLDEEGIDIPFPQQTVHLRVGSPADELARAAEQVARGVRKADKP
ncbi:MAG TPA: mechanosensitive ion channel family protein [Gemmatimonadales bacterium]|nr:mechanosensitive ion channel family protein [Gemmatimonadales bacterium]